jgi:arabinofuranosyltransferase
LAAAANARIDRYSARAGAAWLGACAVAFVALCLAVGEFVTDDAFISVRYADNLANGYGFVWSPHGPPVEGFSNPLLVTVEALAHLAGIGTITAARVAGIGSGLALLILIAVHGPRVVGSAASAIALALVALYPPLAVWAVGGLETLPAALVIAAGTLLLCQEPSRRRAATAGSVFAVLPWLRPEGIAVALAAGFLAELPHLRSATGRREAAVRLALSGGIPVASQLALEFARLLAYGHILPNSVVFKSGAGGTFDVLARFASQGAPVILAAAVGAVLARGRARLLAVPPLVYAAGSLGMSNQVNAFSRFLLPVWPELALLAGAAVMCGVKRFGRARWAVALLAGGALVWAALMLLPGRVADATSYADGYSDCPQQARSEAVKWLRGHTWSDTVYSVSDVGLMAAGSGSRTVIDQLGLNAAGAQRSGALSYTARARAVLDRRPDEIVLVSRRRHALVPRYGTDGAIAADPRFGAYVLAHVARVDWRCHYQLFIYRRHAKS